jgi:hypothetical protein
MRACLRPGLLALMVFFVTFAADASAAPPSLNADAQHLCVSRAEGYLGARLGRWQQRLNLDDWKISVVMAHTHDLKPMTLGNIHWDAKQKTALIHVLDASDYRVSCREALEDMEMTLVHELVHLELSSLPRSAASRREEEFAVNRIADALVQLDRRQAGLPATAGTTAAAPIW